jgi:acetoin utilization deacetylase AcuC-like enzyme
MPLLICLAATVLNNAAIAAQWFQDNGIERVANLDVDFHHGNGTQDILYKREDVLSLSLHGDPRDAFQHFTGYAEETGQDAGTRHLIQLSPASWNTIQDMVR